MPQASPEQLFREARLSEAITAQSAIVRAAPGDVRGRWFLAELLCFAEEWERVDRLLDVIALQGGDMERAALQFRRLLRGEETRRQVMGEGRAPQILGPSADSLRPVVEVLLDLREGRPSAAARTIEQINTSIAAVTGTRNGKGFEDFRDLDDVLSPLVDFITEAGEYFWVPVGDLALIEAHPVSRARDVIWCPARLEIRDGPAGDVFLPAVYVSDSSNAGRADDAVRLGRRTEWSQHEDAPIRGSGLRMFLVGEEDIPIHRLGLLEFSTQGGEV